jgi:hypothetical protein
MLKARNSMELGIDWILSRIKNDIQKMPSEYPVFGTLDEKKNYFNNIEEILHNNIHTYDKTSKFIITKNTDKRTFIEFSTEKATYFIFIDFDGKYSWNVYYQLCKDSKYFDFSYFHFN